MHATPRDPVPSLTVTALAPSIQAALGLLLSLDDKPSTDGPRPATTTTPLARLRQVGLSDVELDWLVELLLVEAEEPALRTRVPGRHAGGRTPETMSYRLTRAGLCWAREVLAADHWASSALANGAAPVTVPSTSSGTPFWDVESRTLWWDDAILLQFSRRHAPNLQALLVAFQKQNWKPCIVDPLSPAKASKANPRLHDAIKNLNKRLERTPLRFRGSGDGKGVRWETVANDSRSSPDFP